MFDPSKFSTHYRVRRMGDSDAEEILELCLHNETQRRRIPTGGRKGNTPGAQRPGQGTVHVRSAPAARSAASVILP